MKYKMFVADFDGTLGKAPDYISKENIAAIREYESRGGKFLVCTGREFSSIRNILNKYDIKGDIICCQGALIGDAETGKTKMSFPIDETACRNIITWAFENYPNEALMVVTDKGLYYNKRNEYTDYYERLTSLNGVLVPDMEKSLKELKLNSYKFMLICDLEKSLKIIDDFNSLGTNFLANSGAKGLVEIVNPEYDKGATLKVYVTSLGIKPEEVITVGDSSNDMSLMNFGFYGVAVGDGNENLKKAAKEVTLPFDDNPVAHLIKKYCL